MKSIVIERATKKTQHDLRMQTRPSGDVEIVQSRVLISGFPSSSDGFPSNEIIGVIPRERLAEVIEWLQQIE